MHNTPALKRHFNEMHEMEVVDYHAHFILGGRNDDVTTPAAAGGSSSPAVVVSKKSRQQISTHHPAYRCGFYRQPYMLLKHSLPIKATKLSVNKFFKFASIQHNRNSLLFHVVMNFDG